MNLSSEKVGDTTMYKRFVYLFVWLGIKARFYYSLYPHDADQKLSERAAGIKKTHENLEKLLRNLHHL